MGFDWAGAIGGVANLGSSALSSYANVSVL